MNPASVSAAASDPAIVDYRSIQALWEIWPIAAREFGDVVALRSPHSHPEINLSFRELYRQLQGFAAGLQAWGSNLAIASPFLPTIAIAG